MASQQTDLAMKRFFYPLTSFVCAILFGVVMQLAIGMAVGRCSEPAYQYQLPIIQDYPLPQEATLFGEPVPLKDRYVIERLDREFTIIVWDRPQVLMWLKRAGRYFPYIEKQLAAAGLPDDLKYIAVAESSFHSSIKSRVGAGGIWQFMPETAKDHGLEEKPGIDERNDFHKATVSAIQYLRNLHRIFGNWTLAVAAYNCGEGRVKNEMEIQKISSFYQLKLPPETERYLFRILSIKLIMENPKKYGYFLSQERIYSPYNIDVVKVHLKIPADIADVANRMNVTYREIKELNPHLTSRNFPSGQYSISIPSGKEEAFRKALRDNTVAEVKQTARHPDAYYTVKKGDTLINISIKTGVSVQTLRSLNQLNHGKIRVGQKLALQP